MPEDSKLQLLDRIEYSLSQEKKFIGHVFDGVSLAADQVQDKRLSLVEQPRGLTMHQFMIDILLSTVLSPLGGAFLQGVTQRIFLPLIRQRSMWKSVESAAFGKTFVLDLKALQAARRIERIDANFPLLRRSPHYKVYREFTKTATENIIAQARQAPASLSQVPKGFSAPVPGEVLGADTAGVAVRAAVQKFLREQEQASEISHNMLRTRVLADAVDKDLTNESLQMFKEHAEYWSELDIDAYMENYKLFWEACIWVSLYSPKSFARIREVLEMRSVHFLGETITRDRLFGEPWTIGVVDWDVVFKNVDDRLVDYWINRFPHNRITPNSGPHSNGKGSTAQSFAQAGRSKREAKTNLVLYFLDMEKGLAERLAFVFLLLEPLLEKVQKALKP